MRSDQSDWALRVGCWTGDSSEVMCKLSPTVARDGYIETRVDCSLFIHNTEMLDINNHIRYPESSKDYSMLRMFSQYLACSNEKGWDHSFNGFLSSI